MFRILIINPGSTSTEFSIFEDEREVKSARVVHPVEELRRFNRVIEQLPYRSEVVRSKLRGWGIKTGDLATVVGRTGLTKRQSGTYEVNQKMLDDMRAGKARADHAALLGCFLAREMADEYKAPAFIAHTSSTEVLPIARVSGIPEIERRPIYHVQNIEAVARVAAADMGKEIASLNMVVAHLEGGMSVVAMEGGRVIDSTSAFDEGTFTMERSGTLPVVPLVELCFSGRYTKEEVLKKIRGEGGMVAYLGTNKMSDVEDRVNRGDDRAKFYLEAMCYQIAKDIGTMATVLKGKVDAVIITGKILESEMAVSLVTERVDSIAPVKTYPEQESLVFALAGLRVLRGEEKPKVYE